MGVAPMDISPPSVPSSSRVSRSREKAFGRPAPNVQVVEEATFSSANTASHPVPPSSAPLVAQNVIPTTTYRESPTGNNPSAQVVEEQGMFVSALSAPQPGNYQNAPVFEEIAISATAHCTSQPGNTPNVIVVEEQAIPSSGRPTPLSQGMLFS